MSDRDLIAEVRELSDEGWCLCTRSGLGDRVLESLEAAVVRAETAEAAIDSALNCTGDLASAISHLRDYRASSGDREPQPTDGPDYHAEHAAWRERENKQ